ncbi:MAG: hypothetical protein AAGI68_07205 [Planctomycetota bacterium]
MDDDRTQQSIDELAELFLTGVNPDPPTDPPPFSPSVDPLAGPAPLPMLPQGDAASAALSTPQAVAPDYPRPPQDHSPNLRLHRDHPTDASTTGPGDPPPPPPPPAEPAAAVEAVLLANLPTVSGPWLTAYAQTLADADGPTAVLFPDDRNLDADLLLPSTTKRPSTSQGALTNEGATPTDLVNHLLTDPAHPVRNILVHLDAGPHSPDAPRLLAFDHWTVLTGKDDAAIAAAGVLLHELADAHPETTDKQVSLVVAGADAKAANDTAARLQAAVGHRFASPLALLGHLQRIAPANLTTLPSTPLTPDSWHALQDRLLTLEPPTEPAPAPAPATPSTPPVKPGDGIPGPRVAATQSQSPKPQAHSTDTNPARPARPNLAELLLRSPHAPFPHHKARPLEARCPHQPDTQLLLGPDGRLHLLRQTFPTPPTPTPSTTPLKPGGSTPGLRATDASTAALSALRAAIVELSQARAWVREHLPLLQLTDKHARFDTTLDPELHLFTDQPHLATPLVAKLGDSLRRHLLQRIRLQDHAAGHCVPLA